LMTRMLMSHHLRAPLPPALLLRIFHASRMTVSLHSIPAINHRAQPEPLHLRLAVSLLLVIGAAQHGSSHQDKTHHRRMFVTDHNATIRCCPASAGDVYLSADTPCTVVVDSLFSSQQFSCCEHS
jgi:hypothetical protein